LPTYLQLYSGKNSIEESDKIYVPKPVRKNGLIGGFGEGKRQNIPVISCILAKSDSAERIGLNQQKSGL
jgi:hypothetical protein